MVGRTQPATDEPTYDNRTRIVLVDGENLCGALIATTDDELVVKTQASTTRELCRSTRYRPYMPGIACS